MSPPSPDATSNPHTPCSRDSQRLPSSEDTRCSTPDFTFEERVCPGQLLNLLCAIHWCWLKISIVREVHHRCNCMDDFVGCGVLTFFSMGGGAQRDQFGLKWIYFIFTWYFDVLRFWWDNVSKLPSRRWHRGSGGTSPCQKTPPQSLRSSPMTRRGRGCTASPVAE